MPTQIFYLQPGRYVALLDPKMVFRLKSEMEEEIKQCRRLPSTLIDHILAEIDLNTLDFTNFYDRSIAATYLLLDRATPLTDLARRQMAEFSLLYVLGEIDTNPAMTRPEMRPVQMGFWEKLKS
jgi:hypothetical protein